MRGIAPGRAFGWAVRRSGAGERKEGHVIGLRRTRPARRKSHGAGREGERRPMERKERAASQAGRLGLREE